MAASRAALFGMATAAALVAQLVRRRAIRGTATGGGAAAGVGSAAHSARDYGSIPTAASLGIAVSDAANVLIANPDRYRDVRRRIVQGGMGRVQVLADFDRTMTSFLVDGEVGYSAYRVLESCELLSKGYHDAVEGLRLKYYPIEVDEHLTIAEKLPHMKQWYASAHELLVKENVTKDHIVRAVKRARLRLRPGCRELVEALNEASAPLTVFSAGLGAVIEEVLRQQLGRIPDNTHVISNRMTFKRRADGAEVLARVEEPIIHMYNKSATHVNAMGSKFAEEVSHRHNIILLGDSLGDITMADGVATSALLKIGFLNDNIVPKRLATYTENYDVVVVGDGSMEIVNQILRDAAAGSV